MRMGLFALAVASSLAVAAAAHAAGPYYARGDFNAWGTGNELNETAPGSGMFTASIGGLPAATRYDFKAATADWSSSWPGNNARIYSNAGGSLTINFFPGGQADSWSPASDRVGYADPGIAWEVMGTFNGWTTPVSMNSAGGGLYTADLSLPAGTTEFKFRKAGDWDYNVGATFEFNGANASFTAPTADTYTFKLDLPNGRWQVAAVPEPTSLGMVLAAAVLLRRRSR